MSLRVELEFLRAAMQNRRKNEIEPSAFFRGKGGRFLMVSVTLFFQHFAKSTNACFVLQKILIFFFILTWLMSDMNFSNQLLSIFLASFEHAIHFLLIKKKCFLWLKIQWVIVFYKWRIWSVVSYRSGYYKEGFRVLLHLR